MQKRVFLKRSVALAAAFAAAPFLAACGKADEKAPAAAASSAAPRAAAPAKVKVAVTAGPHADIVTKAAEVAKKNGLDVEVVEFTDYITPDTALAEKQLDIAVYQHEPFLQNFNRQKGTNLVVAAKAVVQPMGLYSNKIHSLEAIPEGAKVAIPNDPSNGGRAIILLEKAGLVKVKEGAPALPTVHDVAENPKKLQLVELEAAQLPISISDLDIACVPMNYAVSGGLDVKKQGFYFESFDAPFALIIIAARPDNVESEPVKAFVKAYQSPEVAEFIRGKFNGQILPAWEAQK
ncbi:MetQ/NlpA family ABC transporter substrate-binding protein [uncultured Sutterella sp.]|uniref:MetQ/NlpA family ABC transporter substrate-binding protein n=1 Tax=uncultured Sutterella sp. TaxID=286133 RepID=UPI0026295B4C|nr:MetQ/NlpA family ABC transporter substrate-binding protein [uncultured Sutterella sp.]